MSTTAKLSEEVHRLSALAADLRRERDDAIRSLSEGKGKLWLWRNFVDGRPEYWAFDNPHPIHLDNGDPQTLGEPCGYAVVKPSRNGRPDVPESKVLAAIDRALKKEQAPYAEETRKLLRTVLKYLEGNYDVANPDDQWLITPIAALQVGLGKSSHEIGIPQGPDVELTAEEMARVQEAMRDPRPMPEPEKFRAGVEKLHGMMKRGESIAPDLGHAVGHPQPHVAWLRINDYNGARAATIHVCDSDAPGAFKVYRHPVLSQCHGSEGPEA